MYNMIELKLLKKFPVGIKGKKFTKKLEYINKLMILI